MFRCTVPTPVLAFVTALCLGPVLHGQGLFIERDGRRPDATPGMDRIPMTQVDYHLNLADARVELSVEQVFRNETRSTQEGVYLFPLPRGATTTEFELWMNGKPVVAEVLDRDQARNIYESIVRKVRDPGLLEYVGQGLLRARIFPIEAGKEAKVRVRLAWTAERMGDLYSCELPVHVPAGNPRMSLLAELSSQSKLGAVFSPTHEVDVVRQDDHHARASFEGRANPGKKRLRLYYGTVEDGPGVTLLAHRDPRGGHFLATVFTPSPAAESKLPRDVTFVLDRSGSMKEDQKMEQAVGALRHGLATLGAEDRFEIVTFATSTRQLFGGLRNADQENREFAATFLGEVRATGGTGLSDALLPILDRPKEPGRLSLVVLLTDGMPTVGMTETPAILKAAARFTERAARVFCFGVGHDVNTQLLDGLSNQHGALSSYILPGEDLELVVSTFFDRVRDPVLQDVTVDFQGVKVTEVFPRKVGDLFGGSAVHLLGTYETAGQGTIILRGRSRDGAFEKHCAVVFPEKSDDHASIRALFASRKVAFLLNEVQKNGLNQELQDEITRLGKEYGIVTPWTSHLVVEDGEFFADSLTRFRGGVTGAPGAPVAGGRGGEGLIRDSAGFALRRAASEERLGNLREMDRSGKSAVDLAVQLKRMAGDKDGVAASGLVDALESFDDRGDDLGETTITHKDGKTFARVAGAWVDLGIQEDAWEGRRIVVTWSDEYFALLKEHAELRKYLALGDEVIVQLGDLLVHAIPEGKVETLGKGALRDR